MRMLVVVGCCSVMFGFSASFLAAQTATGQAPPKAAPKAAAKVSLPPGKHSFRVEKSGYKVWTKEITITVGSELTLDATMRLRAGKMIHGAIPLCPASAGGTDPRPAERDLSCRRNSP
jgi:hypothetical protein